MDMDHSGLLEKQGNLNLSRRLSRDGDRIGTGERSGVGTTQASETENNGGKYVVRVNMFQTLDDIVHVRPIKPSEAHTVRFVRRSF